jgi:acyl dehydratase
MSVRFLEDFAVGQVFKSGRKRVDKAEIFAFAREYDPQPAMTMRLLVDGEFKPAGGILGVGFDELSWPRAVRPGDELHVHSEVLEVRPSKSRPDRGMIRVRNTTFNQNGEPVQVFTGNLLVPRRPSEAQV